MVQTKLIKTLFITLFLLMTLVLTVRLVQQKQTLRSKADTSTIPELSTLWAYDTHPNFWPAGGYKWTAKKYSRMPNTPSPGFDLLWVWSGPHSSGGRYVIYQEYPNNQPGNYREWELWTGDPAAHTAVVHKYGGPSESSSKPVYRDKGSCQSGTTGVTWPRVDANKDVDYSPESRKTSAGSCTDEFATHAFGQQNGGYISVRVKEQWSSGNTKYRLQKCDEYIPASMSPNGNRICKVSPNAGIVYQRYVIPEIATRFVHGCEATVYTWGYPYDASDNYKGWYRNGEVRYSDWLNLGVQSSSKAPWDNGWWDAQCEKAWGQKANWLYTGIYKLTATEFTDTGN